MHDFSIALHGGIGTLGANVLSSVTEQQIASALEQAIQTGGQILSCGGCALDAVVAAVRILEAFPLFNAGKGAVLNHNEMVEMDACVMCGQQRQMATVAGLRHIEHPVALAKEMFDSQYAGMFVGEGAEMMARQFGYESIEQDELFTEARYEQFGACLRSMSQSDTILFDGSVGAVASDSNGNIAAAASSGGVLNHRCGQVSEVGIRGSSVFADNHSLAVVATGLVPHQIAELLRLGMHDQAGSLNTVCEQVLHQTLSTKGASGGLVALDSGGHVYFSHHSEMFPRASLNAQGKYLNAIF